MIGDWKKQVMIHFFFEGKSKWYIHEHVQKGITEWYPKRYRLKDQVVYNLLERHYYLQFFLGAPNGLLYLHFIQISITYMCRSCFLDINCVHAVLPCETMEKTFPFIFSASPSRSYDTGNFTVQKVWDAHLNPQWDCRTEAQLYIFGWAILHADHNCRGLIINSSNKLILPYSCWRSNLCGSILLWLMIIHAWI